MVAKCDTMHLIHDLWVGLGNTENTSYTEIIAIESLRLLPWYYIGIVYYKNSAQHHYTRVPLKIAITPLSIGMKPVVGFNSS